MGLAGRKRIEEMLAWRYSEAPLLAMYRKGLGIREPVEEPAPQSTR